MGLISLNKKREATPVAAKHIKYVEPLWTKIAEGREAVAAKEAYVRSAVALGVNIAATRSVADAAISDGRALSDAEKRLERIKRVLAAGCEPTTPPEWYCGALEVPRKVNRFTSFGDTFKGYPDETWPGKRDERDFYRGIDGDNALVWVFQGVMPTQAMAKLMSVRSLMDDIRVYSPEKSHFRKLENREPVRRIDPVIIGRIEYLGEPQYFEIARWDIDRDLAQVLGRV